MASLARSLAIVTLLTVGSQAHVKLIYKDVSLLLRKKKYGNGKFDIIRMANQKTL